MAGEFSLLLDVMPKLRVLEPELRFLIEAILTRLKRGLVCWAFGMAMC